MQQYDVTGMTCAACSQRVEKAVKKVDGVSECNVNLLTNTMGVSGTASPDDIIKAVVDAGYGASLKGGKKQKTDQFTDTETPKLKKRLIASLGFLLVLMYVSMGHTMWNFPLPAFFANNYAANSLLQLLLSTVILVINQRFFISGFKSLIKGSPNMDTLVALGSMASYLYSAVLLFLITEAQRLGDATMAHQYLHGLYFESAAMIVTLITVGKMLEARSKGKTTDALKGLIALAPKTATVLRDNKEVEVLLEEVLLNDVFIVRPGENIPVDGQVIEGITAIDQSSLTGESIPVDKSVGDMVYAGTNNKSGYIKCRAVKVGEDTTLSQIIKMVSDAAATKAPIAKIADKVSGIFVPCVMAISLITFIVWMIISHDFGFSLSRGISVLVISCPCALGLATPVAIMVGNGVGAKNGILFKTAESLEKLGKADIVLLDKTGTITEGKPKVTDVIPANNVNQDKLLSVAASLESKSEHPLSYAVMTYCKDLDLTKNEVEDFKILPGNGLIGTLFSKKVYGGSLKYISQNIELDANTITLINDLASQGKTPLLFAEENMFLGIIAVADTIKSDRKKAISRLKNMGIEVIMVTGDNKKTADAIGKLAGVDKVIAEVLPDGKKKVVDGLKDKGNVVMVGDGINDAPALTSAYCGVAIGAGADVAIDAADVVLMKSNLSDVPAAIKLSKASILNIRENLFWAFIYNVIGIPLAAGVFSGLFGWQLNPMFGAACMSLSSFCVVMNALRLNFVNIHSTKHDHKHKKKINFDTNKEVLTMTKTLKITGMMCAHCEMHTKKALEAIDGVKEAVCSHTEGTAIVTLDKDVADDLLVSAVENQGYKVTSVQ